MCMVKFMSAPGWRWNADGVSRLQLGRVNAKGVMPPALRWHGHMQQFGGAWLLFGRPSAA